MATAQAVWGIDLGRCALKAIKLRRGADGNVEVVAADYIEHAKILSQPDADRNELIGSVLEKFLSRNDISKDLVVVSVPGQHTLARFTKLPPVSPKKIPELVKYEADQQIPFDMDEVIWDYQTFQEEDMPDVEVGIFAMKRELIREHLLHFEQAAIEPIAVQCGPLATYNAAHHDGIIGDETTVILDIGAESTDLIIATRARLWTRTVPIGGNNFTEALVKSFKLSFAKAESLKRTAATSKYARQVFQTMRPIFADIVQELQRSIGFYSSTHRDANVEKIVGVGNAFLLPGLQKYLQQNLDLPVTMPESLKKASGGSNLPNADVLKENLLSFWLPYGLALQGLDVTKVNTNLLPTEIAKQVVWRKKRPGFAAAAACLVLAGGLIWFRQTADMRALAATSTGAENVNVSDDRAAAIIDNGCSSTLSARAKTRTILAAGNALYKNLQGLSGQGDREHAEAQRLVDMLRNKAVVPMIFQVVHESIPKPQKALADASTPEQLREALATIARGDREQVFIQSVLMDYLTDVDDPPWYPSLIDIEDPIHDFKSEETFEGFLIKITCRTPNQGGVKFIDKRFLKSLRLNGRREGMGFYFDRVSLIRGEKVEQVIEATGGVGQWGSGRGGSWSGNSGRGGASGESGISKNPQTLDPLTNEPFMQDWEFEIWIDAFLGNYADVAPQEEDSANEG